MNPELKPCPFCGGKPSISKQMGESLWSHNIVLWTGVQCDECEAQVGPTCEGYEIEAVDMWNRRAPAEPVRVPSDDEIEELAKHHLWAHAQFVGAGEVYYEGEVEFARALLAKYGTIYGVKK